MVHVYTASLVISSPISVAGGAATTNSEIVLTVPPPGNGAVRTASVAPNTSVTISAAYNGTKTAVLSVTP